jgi:hypothetical protein
VQKGKRKNQGRGKKIKNVGKKRLEKTRKG